MHSILGYNTLQRHQVIQLSRTLSADLGKIYWHIKISHTKFMQRPTDEVTVTTNILLLMSLSPSVSNTPAKSFLVWRWKCPQHLYWLWNWLILYLSYLCLLVPYISGRDDNFPQTLLWCFILGRSHQHCLSVTPYLGSFPKLWLFDWGSEKSLILIFIN